MILRQNYRTLGLNHRDNEGSYALNEGTKHFEG